ncbi:MAG: alpha/beta hydrolase [Halopseudomonas sp.]|uniref:alpha/beta fold hydrolase n=1 Tax=Halopseudomonas sp. TaxID=2901191 RepID=UPI003001B88A
MLQVKTVGTGPALVWGHGLMGSMAQDESTGWFHQPASPLQLIRYDACGHGLSARPLDARRYHWQVLAADMLRIARLHAPLPCALGGQSMGCASALLAALLQPERISKLVLATPPTLWASRQAQQARYQQMIRLLRQRGMSSFIQLSQQNPALPHWLLKARPQDAAAQLESLKGFSRELLIAVLLGAAASDLPPASALRSLSQPALILAWQGDPTHPVSSAEQLAAALPNAELRIIDSIPQLVDWPREIAAFVSS